VKVYLVVLVLVEEEIVDTAESELLVCCSLAADTLDRGVMLEVARFLKGVHVLRVVNTGDLGRLGLLCGWSEVVDCGFMVKNGVVVADRTAIGGDEDAGRHARVLAGTLGKEALSSAGPAAHVVVEGVVELQILIPSLLASLYIQRFSNTD
jgi:hypothetical protein